MTFTLDLSDEHVALRNKAHTFAREMIRPVAEDLAQRILALPIHPDLTEADTVHICDRVLAALE